jgi:hypothetical protein
VDVGDVAAVVAQRGDGVALLEVRVEGVVHPGDRRMVDLTR